MKRLVGHLVQGRVEAMGVDCDAYPISRCRYVERNPQWPLATALNQGADNPSHLETCGIEPIALPGILQRPPQTTFALVASDSLRALHVARGTWCILHEGTVPPLTSLVRKIGLSASRVSSPRASAEKMAAEAKGKA